MSTNCARWRSRAQVSWLGALFSLLLAPVSGCAAGSRGAAAADIEPVTLRLGSPVLALSWSPTGDRLVYLVDGELRDWPQRRRLKVPASYFDSETKLPGPLAYAIKWRADGQQLSLNFWKERALIVDVTRFRTLRRVELPVSALWWEHGQFCELPMQVLNGAQQRSHWGCGGHRRYGPRGMSITDVSDRGDAALARVAGLGDPGWSVDNIAVIKYDPDGQSISWTKRLYARPAGQVEFSHSDRIVWNAAKEAAALVLSSDTGGGLRGTSRLAAISRTASSELESAYGIQFDAVFAYAPPSWLGDKVLAVVRLFRTRVDPTNPKSTLSEDRCRLILWDPWRGTVQTLLANDAERQDRFGDAVGVYDAVAHPDGRTIAYVWSSHDARSFRLTIADLAQVHESSGEMIHGAARRHSQVRVRIVVREGGN